MDEMGLLITSLTSSKKLLKKLRLKVQENELQLFMANEANSKSSQSDERLSPKKMKVNQVEQLEEATCLPVFAYWDIRGIGEPIRFLLHHVGAAFEDKRFSAGPKGHQAWTDDKANLGLDFPSLPYWVDGETKATQSLTILRLVARKYGLVGKCEEDILRIELAEQQADGMMRKMLYMTYNFAGYESSKNSRLKALPTEVEQFAEFLGDGDFVAGSGVTYVDFLWYHTLDYHRHFDPTAFEGQEVVAAYLSRVEMLPNISKYVMSPSYSRNIFAPFAKWPEKNELPINDAE
ncbi:Glutathione S-transferase [Halotydeus destructor]|nr:Glutathione S-transferase [Halotydeus destructor]